MPATGYEAAWKRDEDLDSLNRRLHDGVPIAELSARADGYLDKLFGTYPAAAPRAGARVLELGSGVGWIMEAVLRRYPDIAEIVGLDISEAIVERAQERFQHPAARFVVYDGRTFPFPDGAFDVLYSCAAIQHIEKHAAFLLFEEMHRVLAPGGHAVLHIMAVDHIPRSVTPYREECLNHVDNRPVHWHHYYTFDELFVLFSEVIKVDDLDIRAQDGYDSFAVHFSKGTGRRFLQPNLAAQTYSRRSRRDVALRSGPLRKAARIARGVGKRALRRA